MSSTATTQLSERLDVHRSCRSLEILVNALNDYCEAHLALVSLQKKLAKALRETAGLKATGEVAANAFNASAYIFEALSETDNKFSKVTDKECEGISNEVRKWFKKLAKEEKAHDEKINNTNARIKQAGQAYEKAAAKKSARDAAEEHARYMNLISMLGPEMSQDKYNHALFVTQRHNTTTCAVATCVSRVADAEWLRSCEEVRRFAPTVGLLGESRALCEGGWAGPPPRDLPDLDRSSVPQRIDQRQSAIGNPEMNGSREVFGTQTMPSSVQDQNYNPPTTSERSSYEHRQQIYHDSSSQASLEPPRPIADDEKMNSVASITTLTSFPTPPSHFPIPPAFTASEIQRRQQQSMDSPAQSRSVSSTTDPPRMTDSPIPQDMSPGVEVQNAAVPETNVGTDYAKQQQPLATPERHSPILPPQKAERASSFASNSAVQYARGDYLLDDREFGVCDPRAGVIKGKGKGVERTGNTTSSGNVVAAMRSRFAHTTGSSSPPLRDLPRLPLSVSDLASRYQPPESPTSPRQWAVLPTQRQQPPSATSLPVAQSAPSRVEEQFTSSDMINEDPTRHRRQEQAEQDLRLREHDLREREREIEARARALEKDHANLLSSRSGMSVQSPSRVEFPVQHRSYSTTHLVPPSPSQPYLPSPPQPSSPNATEQHAPYCGCARCSVEKYRVPAPAPISVEDLRPPEPPIRLRPEKPRGWMRRLSMPVVGNAFSLDSKQRGVGRPGSVLEDGRMKWLGASNSSTTNLGRR